MGRRDNLKILTTAILVVLLLSSFIFAFIYRNEIYQKLQTIGKNRDVEMVDRQIERESPGIPAPKEDFAKNDGKDSAEDRSKLPELPSLDDMEPDTERPRSVSVAASTKTKEKTNPSSSLQEKLDQVEESFSPKEETKKTKKPSPKEDQVSEGMDSTSTTKQPKVDTKDSVKLTKKQIQKYPKHLRLTHNKIAQKSIVPFLKSDKEPNLKRHPILKKPKRTNMRKLDLPPWKFGCAL